MGKKSVQTFKAEAFQQLRFGVLKTNFHIELDKPPPRKRMHAEEPAAQQSSNVQWVAATAAADTVFARQVPRAGLRCSQGCWEGFSGVVLEVFVAVHNEGAEGSREVRRAQRYTARSARAVRVPSCVPKSAPRRMPPDSRTPRAPQDPLRATNSALRYAMHCLQRPRYTTDDLLEYLNRP